MARIFISHSSRNYERAIRCVTGSAQMAGKTSSSISAPSTASPRASAGRKHCRKQHSTVRPSLRFSALNGSHPLWEVGVLVHDVHREYE